MRSALRRIAVAAVVAVATFGIHAPAQAIGLTSEQIAANLQTQIDAETSARYRISVREIGGAGRSIDIGARESLEPASAIKVFFAWLVLDRVDGGTLRLGSNVSPGVSWRTCLKLMITVSDNLCAADIRSALGDDWINRRLDSEGFDDTLIVLDSSGDYLGKRTSTADLAELFVRLESGTLLSPENSAYFHKLLKLQVWRSRIHAGVPAGVQVESKPGILATRTGVVNSDVAIVRATGTTYVISVIGTHDATRRGVARLSRIVYEGMTGVTGYVGATFPRAQFVARSGTDFARTANGPRVTEFTRPRAVELHHTDRERAYVTIPGIGDGWVDWADLHVADAYRWLG